ncbi:uncharacterized protein LOC141851473 [Brevipalpus obovatus]|uniref:uncharacterized protein LOC141851473 n=1 Tax=Brevipalpus obovatus TaxID=246614 RepID=UPI003D9E998E
MVLFQVFLVSSLVVATVRTQHDEIITTATRATRRNWPTQSSSPLPHAARSESSSTAPWSTASNNHQPPPARSASSTRTPTRATRPTRDPYADLYLLHDQSFYMNSAQGNGKRRATHAPYASPPPRGMNDIYAAHMSAAASSQLQSSSSSSTSSNTNNKKQVLAIDPLRSWIKEALSFIASPLFVPSAITKAIKTPNNNSGRSLWSKMLASFRSVILRKGEGDGDGAAGSDNNSESNDRTDQMKGDVASLYKRLSEKMMASPLIQLIQSSRVTAKKEPSKSHRSVLRR